MVKTQAPGYYRMMLGDFEVTVLSDGTLGLPVIGLLTNTTPDKVKKALARASLKDQERRLACADAARNGYWVGAAHLSFPGLGHLRAEGDGYVWIPANYSSLR